VPANGATNPPDEDPVTDDLGQTQTEIKNKIEKKRWNKTGTEEE
jgi:hypothetical protein